MEDTSSRTAPQDNHLATFGPFNQPQATERNSQAAQLWASKIYLEINMTIRFKSMVMRRPHPLFPTTTYTETYTAHAWHMTYGKMSPPTANLQNPDDFFGNSRSYLTCGNVRFNHGSSMDVHTCTRAHVSWQTKTRNPQRRKTWRTDSRKPAGLDTKIPHWHAHACAGTRTHTHKHYASFTSLLPQTNGPCCVTSFLIYGVTCIKIWPFEALGITNVALISLQHKAVNVWQVDISG